MMSTCCMRGYGLDPLLVYFNVQTHDIWERNMSIRREMQIEHIRSLGFQDIREGVTLRRVML